MGDISRLKRILRELSEAHGVSGFEDDVREVVRRNLEGYVDSIEVDKLGNLIARKGDGELRVMIAAHMDEIGLMVKHIDDRGFIRFVKVGGVEERVLPAQPVVIKTKSGYVSGVIGVKPPHLAKPEERKKAIPLEDMFIDVGASSRKEVEDLGVRIGDPIAIKRELIELAGDRVAGKAFDNRLGCLVMIEAIRRLEKLDGITVYAVATVQEELGLKGATVTAFKLNPDFAIALDVTPSGDYPGMKEHEAPLYVGKGPAIKIADGRRESLGRGLIAHPRVRQLLVETAEELEIPYQLEVLEGGTTDAAAIHISREGIPTGAISVVTRYIHSPCELASLKDVDLAAELLARSIERSRNYF